MVKDSVFSRSRVVSTLATSITLSLLAGCRVAQPVNVDATFRQTPAFATHSPSNVAVLPVIDRTPDAGAARHIDYLRQEVNRQLVDRLYSPLDSHYVDAAVRGQMGSATESAMTPAALAKLAGRANEDALFAVQVDRWDESTLMTDHRVRFQLQVQMVAADGELLWSGTIQGDVKAGGRGATPLGREQAARSCVTLAVAELIDRVPTRIVR